ncbi:hypothetical protein APV28_4937 [Comamonas testosteroni]|nr:hypothetical protein APV28_4937 [Comamonas testosteroni]
MHGHTPWGGPGAARRCYCIRRPAPGRGSSPCAQPSGSHAGQWLDSAPYGARCKID